MKTTSLLNKHIITGTLCAGTVLFAAAGASAQTLYESEQYTGAINEFNSAGVATTFVSSSQSLGEYLTFNSSGDLFVGNNSGSTITEITPNGTASSFGFGFNEPAGVAVNSAGDVFVANEGNGEIIEMSPNGSSESLFASGLDNPLFLTFNNSQGDLLESDCLAHISRLKDLSKMGGSKALSSAAGVLRLVQFFKRPPRDAYKEK
jgi:DNA-binding beta-propeller fold protein YncE